MGDKFQNINNSNINNRSHVGSSKVPFKEGAKDMGIIKKAILDGNLELASDLLTDFLDNVHDNEIANTGLIILGRFRKLKRNQQRGTLNTQEVQIEENKISESMLNFISNNT